MYNNGKCVTEYNKYQRPELNCFWIGFLIRKEIKKSTSSQKLDDRFRSVINHDFLYAFNLNKKQNY